MTIGDEVRVTTTGEHDRVDGMVSDSRGVLYRLAARDQWFDDRFLEKEPRPPGRQRIR